MDSLKVLVPVAGMAILGVEFAPQRDHSNVLDYLRTPTGIVAYEVFSPAALCALLRDYVLVVRPGLSTVTGAEYARAYELAEADFGEAISAAYGWYDHFYPERAQESRQECGWVAYAGPDTEYADPYQQL